MDGAGEELFARAAFTDEQDGRCCLCRNGELTQHSPHGRPGGDDGVDPVPLTQAHTQRMQFGVHLQQRCHVLGDAWLLRWPDHAEHIGDGLSVVPERKEFDHPRDSLPGARQEERRGTGMLALKRLRGRTQSLQHRFDAPQIAAASEGAPASQDLVGRNATQLLAPGVEKNDAPIGRNHEHGGPQLAEPTFQAQTGP